MLINSSHFGYLQSLHTCPHAKFFFHGFDVLQPMLVSYDFIFSSHVPSKNALETYPFSSSYSFSAFRMQAGSVWLSRAHLMLFFVSARFSFVYSNLRAFQSVTICLLVCLFNLSCFVLLVCSSIPPIQRDALRF